MKTPDTCDEWIPTRQSLLTRLKHWDDQEGWQEFFDTYWRLIYGVARKAGLNDTEAQEVVQASVITVAKKMRLVQLAMSYRQTHADGGLPPDERIDVVAVELTTAGRLFRIEIIKNAVCG